MIPGSVNPLLLRSAAAGGYSISRSLRFNSADSAYLSRTPASAGNRKTWTWAGWVKRSALASAQDLFVADTDSSNHCILEFLGDDTLRFTANSGGTAFLDIRSTNVFRDPSAWYHIVATCDIENATQSDRARLYVNGIRITSFGTASYPSNTTWQTAVNNNVAHFIGRYGASSILYLSGYLADLHFCDGTAYDASAFGEFDDNGIWQPKAFAGSYGSQGWHLDFADNSSNTATTLGKDTSPNGNNWTPNNLSVTAGAGNDSLVDVPTNGAQTDTGAGGEVRGNYCTWNATNLGSGATLVNGNLDFSAQTSDWRGVTGTFAVSAGKWYWEITLSSFSSAFCQLGIQAANAYNPSDNNIAAVGSNSTGYAYRSDNGNKINNNSSSAYGASFTAGDVVGVALDLDVGTLVFYKNGASQGTAFSSLSGTFNPAISCVFGTNLAVANFGQRPFAYTAPSGFKALNTANLPAGTITTSGSFTGNANADGPFVWLNGVPTAMTINGNAVTFGTHADRLANGFKVRSSSGSYNTAGSNTYSITTTGAKFKDARAQPNP